jgi:hypothetical protein
MSRQAAMGLSIFSLRSICTSYQWRCHVKEKCGNHSIEDHSSKRSAGSPTREQCLALFHELRENGFNRSDGEWEIAFIFFWENNVPVVEVVEAAGLI